MNDNVDRGGLRDDEQVGDRGRGTDGGVGAEAWWCWRENGVWWRSLTATAAGGAQGGGIREAGGAGLAAGSRWPAGVWLLNFHVIFDTV